MKLYSEGGKNDFIRVDCDILQEDQPTAMLKTYKPLLTVAENIRQIKIKATKR